MEYTNYGDLLKWAKLKNVIIKAGDLKDAPSPVRDLTPKEQAYIQGLVDNMHQQFIDDVASGRKRPVSEIQPLATGQVWTGQQAVPLHLIDTIGSFRTHSGPRRNRSASPANPKSSNPTSGAGRCSIS